MPSPATLPPPRSLREAVRYLLRNRRVLLISRHGEQFAEYRRIRRDGRMLMVFRCGPEGPEIEVAIAGTMRGGHEVGVIWDTTGFTVEVGGDNGRADVVFRVEYLD